MQLRYKSAYRPTLEAIACAGWCVGTIGLAYVLTQGNIPAKTLFIMIGIAVCMALLRGWQTYVQWDFKAGLVGLAFWYFTVEELRAQMKKRPDAMWLGKGFQWEVKHVQMAYDMLKESPRLIRPPEWFLKLRGQSINSDEEIGEPWIHGLEQKEEHQHVIWKGLEGNTGIFGITGSGKTRLYETMIFQMVLRGDVVIVFDPKGDKELENLLKTACKLANRPDAFIKFHPAFPSESIRIDPLRNFSRGTERASRITELVQSEAGDSFISYAWRSINNVQDGMTYIGEGATIAKIKKYLESGSNTLLDACFVRFFSEQCQDWQPRVQAISNAAKAKKLRLDVKTQLDPELSAKIHFYRAEVPREKHIQEIDGLLSLVEHPPEHDAKMILNILPLLTMLTAGELGPMLSPDPKDFRDKRPIFDMGKVVSGRHVLYVAPDSMSDSTVGSAISAILISDLKAVAAQRYNYGLPDSLKIHVVIDEAAEIANDPLIAILNKARGAGVLSYLAAQTFNDYIVRFGSADKARMAIGNLNNIIALRTRDRITQDYIVESFGEAYIKEIQRNHSTGSKTEDSGMEFSGNQGESIKFTREMVFPAQLLGKLPNLHAMVMVRGSKIFKIRLPKIVT